MIERRIKVREVAEVRARMLDEQGGLCLLCKIKVAPKDAVLDHCHATGVIRGTLHRSCNALLGKVENNYARMGIKSDTQLARMLASVVPYINKYKGPAGLRQPIHPTFKTPDEKREARNKKARATRAAKAKETT